MNGVRSMPSHCRVSVITPSYNSIATIDSAIKSVQVQTLTDWEMIVCDDGSDDGSSDLIRQATKSDARIRMVTSTGRLGPAAARNIALESAQGLNVALLDADDSLEPTYLETMMRSLGSNVGIVCCDAWTVNGAGRILGRRSAAYGTAEGLDLAGLLRSNRIFVSAVIPRDVVEAAGRFSPQIIGTEDYDLWIRILELGYQVKYVDVPLVRYRTSIDSLSSDRVRMANSDRLVFEQALARGNLKPRECRIAQARRDIAIAAEVLARRQRLAAVGPLLRAARARIRLATA